MGRRVGLDQGSMVHCFGRHISSEVHWLRVQDELLHQSSPFLGPARHPIIHPIGGGPLPAPGLLMVTPAKIIAPLSLQTRLQPPIPILVCDAKALPISPTYLSSTLSQVIDMLPTKP